MTTAVHGQLLGLVSIHDVMPETLTRVQRIVATLRDRAVTDMTLLVVPGRAWTGAQIDQLRDWQASGIDLAGHGWVHTVSRRPTLYHQLHGRLMSRMVAEHLALSESGIAELIRRCHAWFLAQGLAAPTLYVPPAWAMGRMSAATLAQLPFAGYETLGGLVVKGAGRIPLPLTGYEADTPLRCAFLRRWNASNLERARRRGVPLRIGIHPDDLQLGLADQCLQQLGQVARWLSYREFLRTQLT